MTCTDTLYKKIYKWQTDIKICSIPIIKEMQTKTIMRNYCTPIKMAKIKITDQPSFYGDEEQLEPSWTTCGKVQWYAYFKKVWQFLKKFKIYHTNQMTQPFHSWRIKDLCPFKDLEIVQMYISIFRFGY